MNQKTHPTTILPPPTALNSHSARWRQAWTLGTTFALALCSTTAAWGSWSDTDSDSLNDTWTDPSTSLATTLADMNLANADVDGDGATNNEEATESSNPYATDTDADGIPDGEELHVARLIMSVAYLTNWDSDGDYISDYDEYHGYFSVIYPSGQLPSHPGATYSDFDGDGYKNPDDPAPEDPTNYSGYNSMSWYGNAKGDIDSDGTINFLDSDPYGNVDSDYDGLIDSVDPFPNDITNYSPINGIEWYTEPLSDGDGDGIPNWLDPAPWDNLDSDGDGIKDVNDPFPSDSTNFSIINGYTWYGDALNDADSDGRANWEDVDPYDPNV